MFTNQIRIMRAGGVTAWLLLPSILAGLISSATYIGAAVLNALLFTELLTSRNLETIIYLISGVAIMLILRPLADVAGQLLQNRAGLKLKTRLRGALLDKLDKRGPMRAGLGRSGKIQSVLTDGVEAIEPYFIKYFTQLVVTLVTAIALTIGMGLISPLIAIVLLLCGISIVAIPRLWDKALAERGQSHWIAYEDLNADFIDAMMGMSTLKSFGAADRYGKRLQDQSTSLLQTTLNQLRLSLGETGLSGGMKVLGPALGLTIAIFQIGHQQMELSQLFVITMLSIEIFRPFNTLSSCWHEAFFGISALPAMNAIFSAADATPPAKLTEHTSKTCGNISFPNVSYTYLGANELALNGVSFTVPAQQITAIVGLSGSGKSTALGLMMGFDQPSSGTISLAGNNPRQIDITRAMTLVPQDPIIFPGTVREILLSSNPSATEKEMLDALTWAHAVNLHQENADDASSVLNLRVFEHATNLSGGQKQRLAIARALIRDTPILILDESTSALDSDTEYSVLDDIRQAKPELTMLIVTHRIDTAARTDHVIVLGNGEILCQGFPAELAKNPDSAWSKLLHTQIVEG